MYGVGVNDANYQVRTTKVVSGKRVIVFDCPFYRTWKNMLRGCYSKTKANSLRNKSYLSCIVCSEWLIFSNFKYWMEQQEWEGKYLDKDLTYLGSNLYSPETCCFISREINNFLTHCKRKDGIPLGVCKLKTGKFKAQISYKNKTESLGEFNCPSQAHFTWLKYKIMIANQLLSDCTSSKEIKLLSNLINVMQQCVLNNQEFTIEEVYYERY